MKKKHHTKPVEPDHWQGLKKYTDARIALGQTGGAIPLKEVMQFKLAFAHAKDAVYSQLDWMELESKLSKFSLLFYHLHSKADTRSLYLQRPDFGRSLSESSRAQLESLQREKNDVAIVLADGLSAMAINQHAIPVLQRLLPLLSEAHFSIAPLVVVEQGRVAIGDEIGYLLQADLVLVLIGERPGLSSPYSMGAYLTYHPKPGLTDESRNCISNIRPEGLPYELASQKIFFLIQEALRLRLSGVDLKDNFASGSFLP